MDVFSLRNSVIGDYGTYVRSFLTIKDDKLRRLIQEEMDGGFLWPDPLIQLNPSFKAGETLQELIAGGELHPECINIFCEKRSDGGRVVDLDLATVRRGERAIRLVDDAKSTADDVANALAAQGHRVLRVRADEQSMTARVLAALEE